MRIRKAFISLAQPDVCDLTLDAPVLPRGFASFKSREEAAGSPLAERLFAVEGVTAVRLCGSTVGLRKRGWEDWRAAVVQAARALEEHRLSGQEAVAAPFRDNMLGDEEVGARLKAVIASQINPSLAGHGGFVELLEVRENRAYVRMGGGCQGCASSAATMRQGVELELRRAAPQLEAVIDATDHAAGATPYFR